MVHKIHHWDDAIGDPFATGRIQVRPQSAPPTQNGWGRANQGVPRSQELLSCYQPLWPDA